MFYFLLPIPKPPLYYINIQNPIILFSASYTITPLFFFASLHLILLALYTLLLIFFTNISLNRFFNRAVFLLFVLFIFFPFAFVYFLTFSFFAVFFAPFILQNLGLFLFYPNLFPHYLFLLIIFIFYNFPYPYFFLNILAI